MTTGHVFIATSVDGFVARPDDGLDWLMERDEAGVDTGFETFMNTIDGMVMGSGTFRTVLGFGKWPYRRPVTVLSASLTGADLPEDLRGAVSVIAATPDAAMAHCARQGWRRVHVDGGRVIQSFLAAA